MGGHIELSVKWFLYYRFQKFCIKSILQKRLNSEIDGSFNEEMVTVELNVSVGVTFDFNGD
jgi:hypothetical protein